MRQFITSIMAVALMLGTITPPALADDRVTAYPAENPTSTNANLSARYVRVARGTFLRDAFNVTTQNAGLYDNLSVTPGTGMYVTICPTTANTDGTVYQLIQSDANPVPVNYTPQIAADPTLILVQSLLSGCSAPIGPMTAPTTGNSTYYLVEGQVATQGTNPLSQMFVSSNGTRSFQTVDNNLTDVSSFQLKAGTPASSPNVPSVDSGYIPVGTVLVPSGVSQITTGMIAQNNPCGPGSSANCAPFTGWVINSQVVHVNASPSPTPDVGNAAISGQMAAYQFIAQAPVGLPPFIVTSTTEVPNLYVARSALSDLATSATTATTAAHIGPSPLVQSEGGTGSSSPSGVTPGGSGNWTCTGAFPSQTCDLASALTGLSSVSSTSGTFSSASISALTLPSLLNAPCLGTNGIGGVGVGSCPTVPSFNATTPLAVATPAGTVTYSCSACVPNNSANTYTTSAGNQTLPASNTATSVTNYGSVGAWQTQSSIWNGTSASTYTWGAGSDNLGNLNFYFNGAPQIFVQPSASPTTPPSSGAVVANQFIGNLFSGSGASLTNLSPSAFASGSFTAGTCVKVNNSSTSTIQSAASRCVLEGQANTFTADQAINGNAIIQANGVAGALDHGLKFENSASSATVPAAIDANYAYASAINSACSSAQPVTQEWNGVAGATATNYGGYTVFWNKYDGSCSGVETIVLTAGAHIYPAGPPIGAGSTSGCIGNDNQGICQITTAATCSALVACGTVTVNFGKGFYQPDGVATEMPYCFFTIQDTNLATNGWMPITETLAYNTMTVGYAPMIAQASARTLNIMWRCNASSY